MSKKSKIKKLKKKVKKLKGKQSDMAERNISAKNKIAQLEDKLAVALAEIERLKALIPKTPTPAVKKAAVQKKAVKKTVKKKAVKGKKK